MLNLLGTNLMSQEYPTVFPDLRAETLSGQKITFPDDLTADLNILILVFEQESQRLVDTWAKIILKEFEPLESVSYYEIPMISTWWMPLSWQIDNWMRDGIPEKYHDNTATFYGNRKPYFQSLEMMDKSSCYLFILDQYGNIKYRADGAMDRRQESAFRIALEKLLEEDTFE